MLIIALVLSMSSCYVISGQKMRVVKGTYKLTNYTYTPQHEQKDGYTAKTYDYVNDEEYMYEDYLIVTGDSRGYYLHKEASGDNYVKEISLRYEYDTVDSKKVNYVIYNDSAALNADTGINRLGVMKNSFNYSKTAIDMTLPISKKNMRTESISISWKKLTRIGDVSYVTGLFNEMKYYDFDSFGRRGIYELTPKNLPEGEVNEYKYFYYVIDTAQEQWSATAYYSLLGSDEQEKRSVSLMRTTDDWSAIEVDGAQWTTDPFSGGYTVTLDGVEYICSQVSRLPLQSVIDGRIADRLAAQN